MQAQAGSWKLSESNYEPTHDERTTCDKCGRNWDNPIQATVLGPADPLTYQACPFCMSKVRSANPPKKEKTKPETPQKQPTQPAPTPEGDCGHFFGYLAKRDKGVPIPEQCLTCEKMVNCLCG